METLTINIKKKSEVSMVKRVLKAMNVEIVENEGKEITNPELLKRLDKHFKNYDNPEYRKKNYKTIDPNNIWESLGLK
jgi:hypothetical protein